MSQREIYNDILDNLRLRRRVNLLTKNETAQELKISTSTLDKMARAGEIKNIKVGGQVRYTITEVARIIAGLEDSEQDD